MQDRPSWQPPWLLVLLALFVRLGVASADPGTLLRGLDTDEPTALASAIAAIEIAPPEPGLADVLFAAGRASEDRLHDPARALALYERILRDTPDAGVAIAAARRASQLRSAKDHAREAAELSQLMAHADTLAPDEVVRRADALASATWPGALDAALWVGDWMCRTRRFSAAHARYAALAARAPDAEQAQIARRNAAGCAIEAGDWDRATTLAMALPRGNDVDEAVRANLLEAAETGRFRAHLYQLAWLALALVIVALLASLAEAIVRGGVRRPGGMPPVEVLYIAPLAAVMVAAAFAIDRTIAPAVVRISLAGVGFAWLSGATLDLLRARERPVRARALAHVLVCALGVLAVGYIAIWRDGLIDMFAETMKFGPGA